MRSSCDAWAGSAARHLGRFGRRFLLPLLERLVFSRVRQQEIEEGDHANGEQESSRVNRRPETRVQTEQDQNDSRQETRAG